MTPLLEEPALLQRRLRAAFEHVQSLPEVEPGKFSAIGYCFGGLCSILLARMGLGLRTVTSRERPRVRNGLQRGGRHTVLGGNGSLRGGGLALSAS